MEDYTLYNCHAHTFLNEDVPRRFLPGGLVRLLGRSRFTRKLARLLHGILRSENDVFDRWANMLITDSLDNQEAVLDNMARFYPRDTVFVSLSMDMEYMGAGPVKRHYKEQLDELALLKRKLGDRFLPFICVDPHRPKIDRIVRLYVEEHGFAGIKLYPALGYYPYDSRLDAVYAYAQEHQLPVISHGTRNGAVYYRGKRRDLIARVRDEIHSQVPVRGLSKRELCNYFSHPMNYEPVLEKFPELHLDIAHWGGTEQWQQYLYDPPADRDIHYLSNWFRIIKDLMRKYPKLYTDISFTLGHPDHAMLLNVMMNDDSLNDRILFGSDYFLVEGEASERTFSMGIRSHIGEERFKRIANENPRRFFRL